MRHTSKGATNVQKLQDAAFASSTVTLCKQSLSSSTVTHVLQEAHGITAKFQDQLEYVLQLTLAPVSVMVSSICC